MSEFARIPEVIRLRGRIYTLLIDYPFEREDREAIQEFVVERLEARMREIVRLTNEYREL